MLLELSDLQRADMQRRQKVVAKIPVSVSINQSCCQGHMPLQRNYTEFSGIHLLEIWPLHSSGQLPESVDVLLFIICSDLLILSVKCAMVNMEYYISIVVSIVWCYLILQSL